MKKAVILLIVILSILIISGAYLTYKTAKENNKLKICPDKWYDNQMPGPAHPRTSQYFVLNGERRELAEFDINWIEKNCNISPGAVY